MSSRSFRQATAAYLRNVRHEYGIVWLLAALPVLAIAIVWGELQYRMLGREESELLAASKRFQRGETDE